MPDTFSIVLGLVAALFSTIMLIIVVEKLLEKEGFQFKDPSDKGFLRFMLASFSLYMPLIYLGGVMFQTTWVGAIGAIGMILHFIWIIGPVENLKSTIVRKIKA